MKKVYLAVASALTLAAAAPANASVYYQSFESANITGTGLNAYAYGTTNPFSGNPNVPSANLGISGVTFSGASGVQTNGSAFGFTNAPAGSRTAFIQSYRGTGGAISIALTGLTSGQTYHVNFSAARRAASALAGNPFDVLLGASTLASFNPVSTAFNPFTTSFVATSASDTLTFKGSALAGDSTVGLDAISVAVPEPATWAMMIMGFAMIGFGLRSRRKQSVRVTYA